MQAFLVVTFVCLVTLGNAVQIDIELSNGDLGDLSWLYETSFYTLPDGRKTRNRTNTSQQMRKKVMDGATIRSESISSPKNDDNIAMAFMWLDETKYNRTFERDSFLLNNLYGWDWPDVQPTYMTVDGNDIFIRLYDQRMQKSNTYFKSDKGFLISPFYSQRYAKDVDSLKFEITGENYFYESLKESYQISTSKMESNIKYLIYTYYEDYWRGLESGHVTLKPYLVLFSEKTFLSAVNEDLLELSSDELNPDPYTIPMLYLEIVTEAEWNKEHASCAALLNETLQECDSYFGCSDPDDICFHAWENTNNSYCYYCPEQRDRPGDNTDATGIGINPKTGQGCVKKSLYNHCPRSSYCSPGEACGFPKGCTEEDKNTVLPHCLPPYNLSGFVEEESGCNLETALNGDCEETPSPVRLQPTSCTCTTDCKADAYHPFFCYSG